MPRKTRSTANAPKPPATASTAEVFGTVAEGERKFRANAARFIFDVLKMDIPMPLKILGVLVFFISITLSLFLVVGVGHGILAVAGVAQIDPTFYAIGIGLHSGAAVCCGFPLIMRLTPIADTKRLEEDLRTASQNREQRRKARRGRA